MKAFSKFDTTSEALEAATALVESKMSKNLKSFLKKNVADTKESLGVIDKVLGSVIKEKLNIKVF